MQEAFTVLGGHFQPVRYFPSGAESVYPIFNLKRVDMDLTRPCVSKEDCGASQHVRWNSPIGAGSKISMGECWFCRKTSECLRNDDLGLCPDCIEKLREF